MRKYLLALAFGLGSAAFVFVAVTITAILLPTTKNDPIIIGVGSVMIGIYVAFAVIFRKNRT